MRSLILANGVPPSADYLRRLVAEHDLFLATDGAAHKAVALGQRPDIVSGDFDSADLREARAALPATPFIRTPDQTRTDLDKAIEIVRQQGATAITITGATGGRIDHTLGNYSVLLRYHAEIPIRMVDDDWEVRVISGTDDRPGVWVADVEPGDKLGLISFDGRARATLVGAVYRVDDAPIPIGAGGAAHEAIGRRVVFQARGGALYVCTYRIPAQAA